MELKRVITASKRLTVYGHVCAVWTQQLNAPIETLNLDALDVLKLAQQLDLSIKPSILNSVHIGQVLVERYMKQKARVSKIGK